MCQVGTGTADRGRRGSGQRSPAEQSAAPWRGRAWRGDSRTCSEHSVKLLSRAETRLTGCLLGYHWFIFIRVSSSDTDFSAADKGHSRYHPHFSFLSQSSFKICSV